MKAYILIQTDPTRMRQVAKALRGKKIGNCTMVSAETITGPYDVLVACEGPTLEAIWVCVAEGCAKAPGVQRTLTCLVV